MTYSQIQSKRRGVTSEFKYFLIFDSAVVFLIILWIFRRRPRPKMRLRMSGGPRPSSKLSLNEKPLPGEIAAEHSDSTGGRSLTVLFNYNGHSFEAFEALGLPAGSSVKTAEEAFQRNTSAIDAESREFLKAALSAIQKSSRS
jgi:hypothetical protein